MKCKVEKTENANEVKLELTIEAQKFETLTEMEKQQTLKAVLGIMKIKYLKNRVSS